MPAKTVNKEKLLRMYEVTGHSKAVKDVGGAMAAELLSAIEDPEKKREAQALVDNIVMRVMDETVTFIGEQLSEDDVDGIIAFHETPAGRKLDEITPVLNAAAVAIGTKHSVRLMEGMEKLMGKDWVPPSLPAAAPSETIAPEPTADAQIMADVEHRDIGSTHETTAYGLYRQLGELVGAQLLAPPAPVGAPAPTVTLPPCATCGNKRIVISFYDRGPGSPPGNQKKPCPACSLIRDGDDAFRETENVMLRPTGPFAQAGYDRRIHDSPDARRWAQFFCETWRMLQKMSLGRPLVPDEGSMTYWFANAMMAMHEHDARKAGKAGPPPWIMEGIPIWYRVAPGPYRTYAGIVEGSPRLSGDEWVVRLREMDPRYGDGEGRHLAAVQSAPCSALNPRRDVDGPVPVHSTFAVLNHDGAVVGGILVGRTDGIEKAREIYDKRLAGGDIGDRVVRIEFFEP